MDNLIQNWIESSNVKHFDSKQNTQQTKCNLNNSPEKWQWWAQSRPRNGWYTCNVYPHMFCSYSCRSSTYAWFASDTLIPHKKTKITGKSVEKLCHETCSVVDRAKMEGYTLEAVTNNVDAAKYFRFILEKYIIKIIFIMCISKSN